MQVNLNTQNYNTNQLSFGANLELNLDFKELKSLGGKRRWNKIKKLVEAQTEANKKSYLLENFENHQALPTLELFQKVNNSKEHIGGFGGANYYKLVSLPENEISGAIVSLIG